MGSPNARGCLGAQRSGYAGQSSLPSIEAINQIGLDAIDFRRAQLKYVLDPTGKGGVEAASDMAADVSQIQSALAGYGHLTSAGQDTTLWHTAQTQWSALKSQTANLQTLAVGNANKAASALITSTLPTYKTLAKTLTAWTAVNDADAKAKLRSNDSTYSAARTLGITLILISILLGLGIAFAVSTAIKRGVDVVLDRVTTLAEKCMTYLREGMVALAEGDLTRTYQPVTPVIENPSKDEIGQVGSAVNALRERIVASLAAYNQTAERLRDAIGHVARTAGAVGVSSQQMAGNSEEAGKASGEIATAVGDIAQGSERQVRMMEAAKRSAEEVARAIAESASSAQATSEVSLQARELAEQMPPPRPTTRCAPCATPPARSPRRSVRWRRSRTRSARSSRRSPGSPSRRTCLR